jgi:integrase
VTAKRAVRRGNNEGTIFRRADGRWTAGLSDGYNSAGRPKRVYVYGRTRAEVAEKLRGMQQRRDQGRPLVDKQTRLSNFLEDWITSTLPTTVRPSTAASYADQLKRHVIPVLGSIALGKLTPVDVQKWMNDKLEDGLSPRTVQYQHAILRRALAQAERWGLVGRNAAALVQAPRPQIHGSTAFIGGGRTRSLGRGAAGPPLRSVGRGSRSRAAQG